MREVHPDIACAAFDGWLHFTFDLFIRAVAGFSTVNTQYSCSSSTFFLYCVSLEPKAVIPLAAKLWPTSTCSCQTPASGRDLVSVSGLRCIIQTNSNLLSHVSIKSLTVQVVPMGTIHKAIGKVYLRACHLSLNLVHVPTVFEVCDTTMTSRGETSCLKIKIVCAYIRALSFAGSFASAVNH